MEVTPFLEPGDKAAAGMWYIISPEGVSPCERVGHACLTLNRSTEKKGEGEPEQLELANETVVVVAGATPSGPFEDVYYLKLSYDGFSWSKAETESLTPRYEHGIIEDKNSNIYVFGGAQQKNNLDSTQMLKKGEKLWKTCDPKGIAPCPRTCLNVACIDEKMYVFGGGLQGAQPISDTKMHVFDAAECSWTQLETIGDAPTPRLGHVMVANDKKIYIHGGMAGRDIFDQLFVFDTETNKWEQVKQSGDVPAARTAHAGVSVSNFIYIFGGMNFTGALNDLLKFDVGFLVWTKIDVQGPPPPPRLDHTICCVEIATKDSEANDSESTWANQKILLAFGGMDTRGEIFNDLLAIAV